MTLKERLAGPLKLLRELTDASKADSNISDTLIGYAFRSHVLSYRQILNEIEYPQTEAGARPIASFKPNELDLIVDHYFAHTIDLMHAGCHDKIREAVHGIFQDIRVGRCEPQGGDGK